METPLFESKDLLKLLINGSPVLFPTDTLPALAATPMDASVIWELKKRPKNKPLILMAASADQLFVHLPPEVLDDAMSLALAHWPGPLTIVAPTVGKILEQVNPLGDSIGMRIPNCELTLDFLDQSGPLATTSANLSGEEPLIDPQALSKCFPDLPLLGPMPWPKPSGIASTVLKWKGHRDWQILRRGAVIPNEIEKL